MKVDLSWDAQESLSLHLVRQLGLAFYARNLNLQCVLITQQHENGVNRDGRPS